MAFDIHPISRYEEFRACERLQTSVLGYGELEVAPYQLLQSFATSGGAVIGAFDEGALVGFVMGYTGLLHDGTPYHRSQRLAVLPQYQGQGVGERLKRAQATLARGYGLNLMCWTFDPLRSVNAHLNIHKLGAISRRYLENAYAASSSPRDAGVPIDRLWVEWLLIEDEGRTTDDQSHRSSYDARSAIIVLPNDADKPGEPNLSSEHPQVIIQIPQDIDVVRTSSVQNLLAWRTATRAAFTHYFARGYHVVDFVRRYGYLLAHAES